MSDRRYGYFRCPGCNAHWESSNVYCRGMTPAYKQDCRSCGKACMPHRVEELICSTCQLTECICTEEEREEKKKRNIDANKPHRADLCHKCRAGKPCRF